MQFLFNFQEDMYADLHGKLSRQYCRQFQLAFNCIFFSYDATYNSRAMLSLANESFFADLVRYDKESHSYPKGPNVSRVFGRVELINHFKHKSDKNYFLSTTIRITFIMLLRHLSITMECTRIISLTFQIS